MKKNGKRLISIMLSLLMAFSLIVLDTGVANAAPANIEIDDFYYIQEDRSDNTTVRITMTGRNFVQMLPGNRLTTSVINEIYLGQGYDAVSLTDAKAKAAGVVVDVRNNMITVTAPKTGAYKNLFVNTDGTTDVTIYTDDRLPINEYKFSASNNGGLPGMSGPLKEKRTYVGEGIEIEGDYLEGTDEVNVAGVRYLFSKGEFTIQNGKIMIPDLKRPQNLGIPDKIVLTKYDETGKNSNRTVGKVQYLAPEIRFSTEEYEQIIVNIKLQGMDNLRVVPSEGPYNIPTLITVQALDADNNIIEGVFRNEYKIFLRRSILNNRGQIEEKYIALTNVELVRKDRKDHKSPVVGIQGWTPVGQHERDVLWDVVIKESEQSTSEGVAKEAFMFTTENPSPQIKSIHPRTGPNTGGTDVLITGTNIVKVGTPGLQVPNGVDVLPNGNASVVSNSTMRIDYDLTAADGVTYGVRRVAGQLVDAVGVSHISRDIEVRIVSQSNAKGGEIYHKGTNPALTMPPAPGREFDGKAYGQFHYTVDGEDGVVFTTTDAQAQGAQTVFLYMWTTITLNDGSIVVVPEAATYESFILNEKVPTPQIQDVKVEYGFFNDVTEEQTPPGANDGIKPIMMRITGQRFEVYKDENGVMHYPVVSFVIPDKIGMRTLSAISSGAEGDTKVLDDKGNPVDGVYNKLGSTLVVSVQPPNAMDKYALRNDVAANGTQNAAQSGNYKELEGIIQVRNPSGGLSSVDQVNGPRFKFRRPSENVGVTTKNSLQPEITSVTRNGAPVTKLPSDAQTPIQVRFNAEARISNLDTVKVTIDGLDVSQHITKRTYDTGGTLDAVLDLNVAAGFVGKTRLQIIMPEGLMDSHQIEFDTIRGPEIKELIPPSGDRGTIVVIKRDTAANNVGFKVPNEKSPNASERLGSVVLWNGKDINELFKAYEKNGAGDIIFSDNQTFSEFKVADKEAPAGKVKTPGKYVYVVDSDTIYLKIPEDMSLKEGAYNIQIKNPDGSESSNPAIFNIVDAIDQTIIDSINPNKDDIHGGIVTKITAGKDATGRQTNFKGDVDVYFGSQKAEVVAYNLEYTEVYVKVPPLKDFTFPKTLQETVEAYDVPVTVQNKINKSSDTKVDGFRYLNPTYQMEITQVYNEKYTNDPTNPKANQGVEGETLIIRGKNFRLQYDPQTKKYTLPKVMFGYQMADEVIEYGPKNVDAEGKPVLDSQGRAELEWIKVKVPKRPINIAADGSVDLLVQNPDGAKAIRQRGFIYVMTTPQINEQTSILQASRFRDTVTIVARDIVKDGLVVAFGNLKYQKELSASPIELETLKEIEKIVIRYSPNVADNMEILYRTANGSLIPMTDTENTNGGKFRLGAVGEKKIIGINWANLSYHSTEISKNPGLIAQLNKEYVQVSIENTSPGINSLVVRRGLGKIEQVTTDETTKESKIVVKTPYWHKAEMTTVSVINADGASDDAPFEFHGGLNPPVITNIEGSKPRNIKVEDKNVNANVYTTDYTEPDTITLIGKNFKDVERVMIGDYLVQVLNINQDYTQMKLAVPAGKESDVGKPLLVTVVTKEGSANSGKSTPPVYFMYIKAGSKPIISNIEPPKGPQTGGTKITIEGTGFNEKDEFNVLGNIEVTIGGKKATVINKLRNERGDITALEVITPPVEMVEPGTTISVKNADQGRSKAFPFLYISQPVIEKIEGDVQFTAQADPNGNKVTVKVVGKNFYNPQYVIIGGKTVKIDQNRDAVPNALMFGVKSDKSNQYVEFEKTVEGGTVNKGIQLPVDTTKATKGMNGLVDSFIVTIPAISPEQMDALETNNVVVVNNDGGVSPQVPVKIKKPIPEAPAIIATPGFNNTINLAWHLNKKDLNKPDRFEVYVKEAGSQNDYMHVGDVPKNQDGSLDYSFIIKDTKPNTAYQIKVRVMNGYGLAEDYGYATITTLALKDDYKQNERLNELERAKAKLRQEGKASIVGNNLEYTVGTTQTVVPIASYTKVNTKQIRIPVSQIILSPNTTITINDAGMRLQVPYSAFNLAQVQQASPNAVVAINIKNNDGRIDERVSSAAKAIGKNRASRVHQLDFWLVDPKKQTKIEFTNAPLNMTLQPTSAGTGIILGEYFPAAGKIMTNVSPSISDGGYYVLLKNK